MKHGHWQLIWILILTASLAGIGAGILFMSSDEVEVEPPGRELDEEDLSCLPKGSSLVVIVSK